ncbi:uncharacterized protein LOC117172936 isoform X1 [Belonocnema kinseyi]|uniref:uncharacterized protein LOC117172936 isoform X1 n=1 Tax=Belonocnema kinseyi TaxID=2817044 RepID=UPI00143D3444|nr:uncharacterized protein LOC117172936 isoform X1 [Belonocnema kinseyi]
MPTLIAIKTSPSIETNCTQTSSCQMPWFSTEFPDPSYRYPPPAMKFLQVMQLPSPSGMSSEPAMVQGDDWRNPADHRLRFLVRVNRTLEPPGLKNRPKNLLRRNRGFSPVLFLGVPIQAFTRLLHGLSYPLPLFNLFLDDTVEGGLMDRK